jgi:hypothetical protein
LRVPGPSALAIARRSGARPHGGFARSYDAYDVVPEKPDKKCKAPHRQWHDKENQQRASPGLLFSLLARHWSGNSVQKFKLQRIGLGVPDADFWIRETLNF